MNKSTKKTVIFVVVTVVFFVLMTVGVIALSLDSYYANNTWVVMEITQDSGHGVVSQKEYKRKERLEIPFCTVMVDYIEHDRYAVFSCKDGDIIYNGQTLHKAKMKPGAVFEVRKGDDKHYTVKFISAYYQ